MKDLDISRPGGSWQTVAKPAGKKLYDELRADGFGLEETRIVLDLTKRVIKGGHPDFRVCPFCGCKPPDKTHVKPRVLAAELQSEFPGGMALFVIDAAMREMKREWKIARDEQQRSEGTK